MGKKLSTTSYAILGLLALRDWTTYELAKQMERGVGEIWSAARSMLYAEPKRLVALNLATVRSESVGRRPRAVYSITDAGRRELGDWLAAPGIGPALEFEGLLKVLLMQNGDREGPVASIRSAAEWAGATRRIGRQVAEEYLAGAGPFPDRKRVVALTFAFLWEFTGLVDRWAAWAEDCISTLSDEELDDADVDPFARALRGLPAIPAT